jgi:soluble P-type ATPase
MGEKASNLKSGIHAEIPGLGRREIRSIVSDYSGTLSRGGRLADGVEERLLKLLEVVDVHILTSDTFGTAREELRRIPAHVMILVEEHHDIQKQEYVRSRCDPRHAAAFGNGNNDRLLLKTVKEAGGIAVAVDNGEGCATETLLNANLFISGAANALDLLLDPKRLKATLRF